MRNSILNVAAVAFLMMFMIQGLYAHTNDEHVKRLLSKDVAEMLRVKMDLPPKVGPECPKDDKHPFGCCHDKARTPARKDQSCERMLCYDPDHDYCLKEADCGTMVDKQRCPYTCQQCQPKASPKDECLKNNPDAPYGCCWDGTLATSKNSCTECKDFASERNCRMVKKDKNCMSGRLSTREWLKSKCANFCGFC